MNSSTGFQEFSPQHPFLICIDSDGCVLDSMEAKHRGCFIPNMLAVFGLQAIEDTAWETALFTNLYSQTRGMSRYVLMVRLFDLLARRDIGLELPDIGALRQFVDDARYSNSLPGLRAFQQDNGSTPDLEWAAETAQRIDACVRDLEAGPVFEGAQEALQRIHQGADSMVVSVTPTAQLLDEWESRGLNRYVTLITGQEFGSKTERIQQAMQGRYAPDRVLMIGDSPGDLHAAQQAGALFFPILAGHEMESWRYFLEEGLERFWAGKYAGDYQDKWIAAFNANLPDTPPWE